MSRSEYLIERLAAFIQAVWNEGRLEAVDDYLSATYRIRHDPGDPWEGRTLDPEGFKERLRQSRAPFPDQSFHVERYIGGEAAVAMFWTWTGTHLAEVAGFAATGQVIRMSGATLYDFDPEDRICGHWQIRDNLGVFQQLQQNRASEQAAAPWTPPALRFTEQGGRRFERPRTPPRRRR